MLKHYASKNINKEIDFIYCAKSANEFVYRQEIDSIVDSTNFAKVTYFDSEKEGQINGEKVGKIAGGLKDKKIFMCGPKGMMDSLTTAFLAQKIHPRNIIFEDFSFK